MKALIASVPLFGLPVFNPIASWVIYKVLSYAFDKSIVAINYGLIDWTKAKESKEFLDAAEKLRIVLGSGTDEEIKAANELFNQTFANAIHLKH